MIEFNPEKHRLGIKCRKCQCNIRYLSNAKCVACYSKKSKKSKKRYLSALKRATPPWANMEAIKAIYVEAKRLGMSVDHYWPLRNAKFCGLHVESNLRIITLAENSKKKNKRPE